MVLGAEKESADSRMCADGSMGTVNVAGSKSFLSWHFCEHCFCHMFSSLWPDSVRVKTFVRAKKFMLLFECGAKKGLHLEDQRNLFVLIQKV